MEILQLTSLLFFTVTIHAFYARNIVYYNLSLLITILSILTHGTVIEDKKFIKKIYKIDEIVSHFTFLYVLLVDSPKVARRQPLVIIILLLILTIRNIEYRCPEHYILLHSLLHLVCMFSLHIHLYYLKV